MSRTITLQGYTGRHACTGEGLRNALMDGHSLIWQGESNMVFEAPVCTDGIPSYAFAIRGAGHGLSSWNRRYTGRPFLYGTDPVRPHIDGVTLQGMREWQETDADGNPPRLLDWQYVDLAFLNLSVNEGAGGVRIGFPLDPTKTAQTAEVIVACSAAGRPHGIRTAHLPAYDFQNVTGGLTVSGAVIERNGHDNGGEGKTLAGLRITGCLPGHESYGQPTTVRVSDCRFEHAGANGFWGLDLDWLDNARISGNRFSLANVRLGPNTRNIVLDASNAFRRGSGVKNLGLSNTVSAGAVL